MQEASQPSQTLDYASPRPRAHWGNQVLRIFLCTALFAASHLIVEYQAQHAYHLGNPPPPGTWPYQKAKDHLEQDMMIETIEVFVAAIFVLAFQCFFYRQTPHPRSKDWAVAIALGFAFCAWRWTSWWLFNKSKSRAVELAELVLLGAISGVVLAKWRQANRTTSAILAYQFQEPADPNT